MTRHSPLDTEDFQLAQIERRARALLTDEEAIAPVVRRRLAMARQEALASHRSRLSAPVFRVPSAWLPMGVLVASVALAVAVWIVRPSTSVGYGPADMNAMEDAEVLASNEEPDLYNEDAAFYEWVNAENNSGG